MNIAFLLAALGSFAIFGIHLIMGGRENVRPLLETESLPQPVVMTLYYCWHLVSITLLVIGFGFLYAALYGEAQALAAAMTGLCVAFGALSFVITKAKGLKLMILPQWTLFFPVAACGIWGLTT